MLVLVICILFQNCWVPSKPIHCKPRLSQLYIEPHRQVTEETIRSSLSLLGDQLGKLLSLLSLLVLYGSSRGNHSIVLQKSTYGGWEVTPHIL
eukprot:gene4004-7979_t